MIKFAKFCYLQIFNEIKGGLEKICAKDEEVMKVEECK